MVDEVKAALDEAEGVPGTIEVDGETLTLKPKITARALVAGQDGDVRGMFKAVFVEEDVERAIDLLDVAEVMEKITEAMGMSVSKFAASTGSWPTSGVRSRQT